MLGIKGTLLLLQAQNGSLSLSMTGQTGILLLLLQGQNGSLSLSMSVQTGNSRLSEGRSGSLLRSAAGQMDPGIIGPQNLFWCRLFGSKGRSCSLLRSKMAESAGFGSSGWPDGQVSVDDLSSLSAAAGQIDPRVVGPQRLGGPGLLFNGTAASHNFDASAVN